MEDRADSISARSIPSYRIGDIVAIDLPRRKTIRLKDYDYSQTGYYFVTICTQNREKIFGQIVGADSISARSETILSNAGMMVEKIYCNMQNEFKNVVFHEYIFMPNHFHGIIQIQWADMESRAHMDSRAHMESAPTTANLSTIIQSFKRYTTIEYIHGVKNDIYPLFNKRIWQRGYHEHIIRNEQELQKIREYIINNPAKWQEDKYFI